MICGIDLSSFAVDAVLLDETSDAATWHRYPLTGQDAFDRARAVQAAVPSASHSFWDDILAVGIEQPRGNHGIAHIARVQGAVLSCIPSNKLVYPWNPSSWRKTVGLPGNASKQQISEWVQAARFLGTMDPAQDDWPQDACDAYCIALATRTLLQRDEAA